MAIFVGVVSIGEDYQDTRNGSSYAKGIRDKNDELMIINSGTDNVFTRYSERDDNNYVDIEENDLPIFINNNRLKVILPNSIISTNSYDIIYSGTGSLSGYINEVNDNTILYSKNAMIGLHGGGGGGAGSGFYNSNNYDSGGGGGGSGAYLLVRIVNPASWDFEIGNEGFGGSPEDTVTATNGGDGGTTKITYSNYYANAGGGKGGLHGNNSSNKNDMVANSGGAGGLTSTSLGNYGTTISTDPGIKGGASNNNI
jgi:hypothetical protein